MMGNPNLSYFRLELKGLPHGVRRGLWKQFFLSFAVTAVLFVGCMVVVYWLVG
jgi:hypothetical protein